MSVHRENEMTAEVILANAAGVSSIAAFWMFSLGNALRVKTARRAAEAAAIALLASFACVSIALAMRGLEAERFPVANLYESLLLFSWGLLLSFFILRRKIELPHLGWLTALTVSTVFLYSSWLPANQKDISPLMPALVSGWRVIHVPPLIVSYAFLMTGGLLSLLNLWLSKRRLTALSCLLTLIFPLLCIVLGSFKLMDARFIQVFFFAGMTLSLTGMLWGFKKDSAHRPVLSATTSLLDELSQKSISIAFPLLTFGIITGALWANHAWGSYWSWDPKESMSLATWLSYAGYLHVRARSSTESDVLAVWAVSGLVLTLMTYLGFTFLPAGGLHSYGQV